MQRSSAWKPVETNKLAKVGSKEMLKAEIRSQQSPEKRALLQFISWPPVTLNEMPVR
jgi:hypothetical protein